MTNMKTVRPFTDHANQLHFVNTYLKAHVPSSKGTKSAINVISKNPVLLLAKTADSAVELEYLSSIDVSSPAVPKQWDNDWK